METNKKELEKAAIQVFRQRLTESVRKKGISWSELAHKTGIPKSAMSAYKNGEYRPKQNNGYQMAVCLGVDPSWLMAYDIQMGASSSSTTKAPGTDLGLDERLISHLTSLTEAQEKFVLDFLQLSDSQAQRVMDFLEGVKSADRA